MYSLIIILLSLCVQVFTQSYLQNEPNFKVEQTHYLDFPVTKKDFTLWNTMGTSLFLKNKFVIAPESRDKKGIIYSLEANPLRTDWLVDIELNIGNDKKTFRGGTGVGIFYLKNIDKVSFKQSIFGYTNQFEGLGIYVNTILRSEGPEKEIQNAIQGYYSDGTKSVNVFSDKTHICFKKLRNLPDNQYFKLRIQYDQPLISVSFFNVFTNEFEFCFSFEADLNFNGYFLLSGSSGVQNPDHIYLKSLKLYDPKSASNNDHFQEARHAKAEFEELQKNVKKGVKDLFEFKSTIDTKTMDHKNLTELFKTIPQQHQQLQHTLQRVIEEQDLNEEKYFNIMKNLPKKSDFVDLMEKVFMFKIALSGLSQDIENQNMELLNYEKELKKVRFQNDIPKSGISRKEVRNSHTTKLQTDLNELHTKLQSVSNELDNYSQTIKKFDEKISSQKDFTSKLEVQRKKFAKEQSEVLLYDMSEIDKIFDDLEEQIGTRMSWGSIMVNIGMALVILASLLMWVKLNSYETKNS